MSVCPILLQQALLEDVREINRSTNPGASRLEFATAKLVESFLKKNEDDISSGADQAALDKFIAVNNRCGEWTLKVESTWDEELVGLLKQEVYEFWNSLQVVDGHQRPMPLVSSFGAILDEGRTGPGAALDANASDFYSKLFSSRLTSTKSFLLDVYKRHFAKIPTWKRAEEARDLAYGSRIVEGNRLAFVPKRWDISRVACTEPAVEMFFQLGFGAIISRRLASRFKIEETQPYWNRQLARFGSRHGSLATIDLSSASDSISLRMLRAILPPDFLSWLEMLRSPMCRLPDGTDIKLHMVSTMGNGFTFQLETMLFACVVAAVYRQMGIPLVKRGYFDHSPATLAFGTPRRVNGNFAVWGDDIVCDVRAARRVITLLELLGFEVNAEKSFYDQNDPFRESCGYDYLHGEDVRAVYVKSLKSVHSRFALINRLNRWSASQGFPLRRTVRLLLDSVPFLPVPRSDNDDAGVKVPLSWLRNRRLIKTDSNNSLIYHRWVVRPVQVSIGDTSFKYPSSVRRKKLWNPDGLHIAFLGGYIRDSKIGVKVDVVPYRTRRGISCNWDALPSDLDRLSQGGWQHWASAVAANVR